MDKIQTEYVSFRAEPHHRRKLRQLATSTGVSISNVLRQLVDCAEVQPVTQLKPTVRTNSKSAQVSEATGAFAGINQ